MGPLLEKIKLDANLWYFLRDFPEKSCMKFGLVIYRSDTYWQCDQFTTYHFYLATSPRKMKGINLLRKLVSPKNSTTFPPKKSFKLAIFQ